MSRYRREDQTPSEDHPSTEFINALREGMLSIEDFSNSKRDYIAEFMDKLEAVKKSITESDGVRAESFGEKQV